MLLAGLALLGLSAGGGVTRAQTVVGSIPFGSYNSATADLLHNRVYAGGSSLLGVANTATNTVEPQIPVTTLGHDSINDVAVNPVTGLLYAAIDPPGGLAPRDSVAVLDTATLTLLTSVPVGHRPFVVRVNPATNRIYVTSQDGVSVIDGATNQVTTLTDPRLQSPFGLAIDPLTNRIYVGGGSTTAGAILILDGATDQVTSTISVPRFPDRMVLDPFTQRLYVNYQTHILVIDLTNDHTLGSIGGDVYFDLGLNVATNTLYAADDFGNDVKVVDGATLQVLATLPTGPAMGPGTAPTGVAVNAATNRTYVTTQFPLYTPAALLIIAGPTVLAALPSLSCQPTMPNVGQSTTCTLGLGSNLPPGGSVVAYFTTPGGVSVGTCTAPVDGLVCGTTSVGSLTLTCPLGVVAGACPAGASAMITVSATSAGTLGGTVAVTPPSAGTPRAFPLQPAPPVSFVLPPPAAPTKVCPSLSLTAGAPLTCTLSLSTPLPAGSTLTDSLTNPAGGTVTSCSNATGGLVCAAPAPDGSVSLSCTPVAPQTLCAAGASVSLGLVSTVSGAISEQVVLTLPGGAPQPFSVLPTLPPTSPTPPPSASTFLPLGQALAPPVPAETAPALNCATSGSAAGPGRVQATCTLTLTALLPVGGSVSLDGSGTGTQFVDCGSASGGLSCAPSPAGTGTATSGACIAAAPAGGGCATAASVGSTSASAPTSLTLVCLAAGGCAAGASVSVNVVGLAGTTLALPVALGPATGPEQDFTLALSLPPAPPPPLPAQVCPGGAVLPANVLCPPPPQPAPTPLVIVSLPPFPSPTPAATPPSGA